MYFTSDDDYQFYKVFPPMLNSLAFDNNKKVTTSCASTEILQKQLSYLILFLLRQ